MKNQVIKNLSSEMGKEIIKYFQSLGVNTHDLVGKVTVNKGCCAVYYGVINGKFSNWELAEVEANKAEIVELPKLSEFKRGDKVLVWDKYEEYTHCRTYIAYIEGAIFPHVVVANTYNDNNHPFLYCAYKNCKAIPVKEEPILVHLSFQDISDGRGVGIPVELIRIKAD